jgi:hypothetical protein
MIKSKPTLAIYGDSFGDPRWVENDYLAWPELLEQHYNITNYAFTGTGLWWSYDKFIDTHQRYDQIIFVVTVPGRIYIESLDKHLNLNPSTWPIWRNIALGELYFRLFYSEKRENRFHKFIVDDILTHNNVLVVPAFKESIADYNGWSLCHFADTELAHYGLEHNGWNEHRKCHMSMENNEVIYKHVLQSLTNGTKILNLQETDFIAPADPSSRYWK